MNVMTLTPQDLVSQELTTSSRKVAEVFDKNHKDVLRKIDLIECSDEFGRRNFTPSSYNNEQNKPQPMQEMTKDGFIFLVMGFTGKKAAQIKENYIGAFNWMEQQLRENALCVPVTPQHKADHMVSAGRTFKALVGVARSMGMDRQRAIKSANAATERATGVDLIIELGADDLLQAPEVPDRLLAYDSDLVAMIRDWIGERETFTLDELVQELGMPDINRKTIGMILRELGWQSQKFWQGQSQRRRYTRAAWST